LSIWLLLVVVQGGVGPLVAAVGQEVLELEQDCPSQQELITP
jgi:hypothetical protein